MTTVLAIIVYLSLGWIITVWLGRRKALTAKAPNFWGILWLVWPITVLIFIYLFFNALVYVPIAWDDEIKNKMFDIQS